MSSQEDKYEAQNIDDSTEETDDAFDTVTVPVPPEEPQESDQTEEHESGLEQFNESRAMHVEEQSAQSFSSVEPDNEQLMEEVVSPIQVSYTPLHHERQFAMQSPNDNSLAFLDKIKAVKESLQESKEDSLATVKVVLIPVGQEIVMPFKVDTILKHLKDHFSHLLGIPHSILQIRYSGKILKNNETLVQHGVKPQEIAQVEIFSANPDQYPVKRIVGLTDVCQIITVTVQTGIDQYQEVTVEIVKSDFHKPFLGGFRHKITGVEYHNAGTQTIPRKIPERSSVFCRDTQTIFEKNKLQQTTNTASTQMTNIGVYVSNMTDKLVTPGKYFSAAEYHAQRLKAVIVIQTYFRQWHAKTFVEKVRRQKRLRLEWERQEELRKIREKEEWIKLDYDRRHNPKTNEDFELLYNALEFWWQEELRCINQSFTGAERKAALCELLEKETQIIASIGRHRYIAYMANQEAAVQAFLDKEHECKLTQEILELIDREVDLMMRGVKHHNLEGLRKRIATLFFHYIKTPLFNPQVAKYLKVPQDPLKFYKKIYFCHSCQLYLPSTEFSVSSTSRHIYRCRNCISLENEAQKRESFLKYKCLLQQLYYTEADYEDDSKIAFLMQLQDIQYLTENIWASQSVLSAWDNLSDLAMVRWNKSLEWSPWNCILLTKDEAAAHLKLTSIEEGYERSFIHKIKHKHILAKNYFSQIPVLASFILDDGEIDEIRQKYRSDTTPKIIESQRPPP
ncbi:IQ motif and ubiquitin-like domain-containing protein isoform X2 [Saimiri boliviensis]|uniref:IQ motif and ubiquitin-like domain-containing protein isoform X2 n=1 Tax=Saimiri boliviensis TaxID=27679 RepID=UPI000533DD9C|nr:IQ and ubiquitin-like domain-containing protein isoform X2 [Saimiri boliviensis boliviensis]